MTATTAFETELSQLISEYPRPAMAIVPALQRALDGEEGTTDARVETVVRLCGIEAEAARSFLETYPEAAGGSGPALCVGLSCYASGAGEVRERYREDPGVLGTASGPVRLVPCLGHCHAAPAYRDAEGRMFRVTLEGT